MTLGITCSGSGWQMQPGVVGASFLHSFEKALSHTLFCLFLPLPSSLSTCALIVKPSQVWNEGASSAAYSSDTTLTGCCKGNRMCWINTSSPWSQFGKEDREIPAGNFIRLPAITKAASQGLCCIGAPKGFLGFCVMSPYFVIPINTSSSRRRKFSFEVIH